MKKRRRQCAQLSLLLGGIFLISLGLCIFIFLESIYEFILNDALKFTPTSEAYKAWRTNDPPLDLDLYLFNWTNAHEVRKSDVKPHFEEVGPYRVKEVKEKTNITWHDNNTISYRFKKLYFYDPETSIRNLDEDNITTLNAVPLTVAYQAKNFSYFTKKLISFSTSSITNLYVTKTAREILFDGYKDGILRVLSSFPALKVQPKFGIFYGRNATINNDAVLSMYTKNDGNFGRQLTVNYENHTDFYKGQCNEIRGSASEFYPLNIKKTKLVFYSSELCKVAELDFVREEVIKGVLGYRFTADDIFDNGTKRPEYKCFCKDECIPSGVLDVSVCRQNSPSFLSFPHFYAADPYYTDRIDGMKPNRSRHEFFVVIEPKSGIIMDIGAYMQLNMLLQPVDGFGLYQGLPKIYVPIFYFAQHVGLSDDLAEKLRLIQSFPEFLQYASLIFGVLGTILVVWAACSILNVCSPSEDKLDKKLPNALHEEMPLNEKIARA